MNSELREALRLLERAASSQPKPTFALRAAIHNARHVLGMIHGNPIDVRERRSWQAGRRA